MLLARRYLLMGLGVLCPLAGAGCAAKASGPPTVAMSLLAPTDGATVYVRSIVVLGKVTPENARVLVGGRRVAVRRGTFRMRLSLPLKVNHIGILATASGYRPQSLMTTVLVGRSHSPGRSAGQSSSVPAGVPGYFATRAQAICSTADQRSSALPKPTSANLRSVAAQYLQISQTKTSQLVSLSAPFMHDPDVRTFVSDMRAEAADEAAFLVDLSGGDAHGAARLLHRDVVMSPTWWQDAGKLGVPDCGAQVVQVG